MLISAREAVRRLGVKPATLYAYVSRGLVRSIASPGQKEHRYYAADVQRLKRNKRKGRRTGTPPAAFDLYAPVLDTSLCLIEEGSLYYRGHDASRLCQQATLEDVADLMWNDSTNLWELWRAPTNFRTWLREFPPQATAIERAKMILVRLATQDVSIDTTPPVVAQLGRGLVRAMAAAITGQMPTASPVHEHLARAWRLDAGGADLVRRCLVLAADHELNVSTYVARCVASTGATLYAVVLAALSALSGPRHGGAVIRVEAALRDLMASSNLRARIIERLQLGEQMPGFAHPLYPHGDPRATEILHALKHAVPKRQSQIIFEIASEVQDLSGRPPSFDSALAATCILLELPEGAAQGLLCIGRSVGWIAHALEQYSAGVLIRPRARYVGVLPEQLDNASR